MHKVLSPETEIRRIVEASPQRILARGLSDSLGSEGNLSSFCRKMLEPGDPGEAT